MTGAGSSPSRPPWSTPTGSRGWGLVDTLCTVWIPWGIHGYWFKCEPEAEQFWERHASEFINSVFGGVEGSYGPPPDSPWKAPVADNEAQDPGGAMGPTGTLPSIGMPTTWSTTWRPSTSPERTSTPSRTTGTPLPFHFPDADGNLVYRTPAQVAEMWNHPGLLFSHPDFGVFPVYGPEDLGRTYPHPALYLYSAFLMPQAFEDGFPADDHIPRGNPYADSFVDHFPDLPGPPRRQRPLHPRRSPRAHQRGAFGLLGRRDLIWQLPSVIRPAYAGRERHSVPSDMQRRPTHHSATSHPPSSRNATNNNHTPPDSHKPGPTNR